MRPVCRAFQLATLLQAFSTPIRASDSFLTGDLVRKGQVQTVLEHQPAHKPTCENSTPTGPIETTMCDYQTVESVNDDLYSNLSKLVSMPFFKYFQVDLYRDCPFWSEYGSCSDPGCAITSIDESDIPMKWRAETLSKVESSSRDDRHQLPGCYYRDSDFCFLDDNTEGDYYDLSTIPERFTGYSGHDAHRVWRAIYEENCFGLSELNLMSAKSPSLVSLPESMSEVLQGSEVEDQHCLEKRVYYKIISGLHASISTHICREHLNQTTGEWGPNLQCFVSRIASHPERLQYIYFNTVLLQRAVARLGPYLMAYDYCSSGNHEDDEETRDILSQVINTAREVGKFDESILFRGENANILKEEFKSHFRNVTRIMDCVGCDKCRLWGKVQTTGVATAMKILFEMDEKALDPHSNSNLLQRSEVVALINTLHRFTESLKAVEDFREMWRQTSNSESEQLIRDAEKSARAPPLPRPSPLVGTKDSTERGIQSRLNVLLRGCKDGTAGCLSLLLSFLRQALEFLASILTPSGKEKGPGEPSSAFGEL